jgi:enoyl-CoA hydratase/carnithine racemase
MLIETERHGAHVVLTLNRPDKLNALSYALIDELMDRLNADLIAAHSAVAVTASLRAVTRGLNVSIDEGLAIEAAQFMVAAASVDAREECAAFVEKRQLVFPHR